MGIISQIRKEATDKKVNIQSSEASELEKILNETFYLEKDIEEEAKFVKQVMTRGAETQERVGLHASALIARDSDFCIRAQVLSLIYRQLQGEQVAPGLKRIFEQGNAIHEKWQRLFIRAGYSKAKDLDVTQFSKEYKISYTPDIICKIPKFFEGKMIGEIKSVNTYQFQRMQKHPSAHKQLQWYMFLCIKRAKELGKWNGIDFTKGFVLSEDKNTQNFKIEVYDYNKEAVAAYVDRAEQVTYFYNRVFEENKMAKRPNKASSPSCKLCENCSMREACWNIGKGKARIE